MQIERTHKYELASLAQVKSLGEDWRICPACGKKEFKPFVDAAGQPIARECGRCNRERNCGYILSPRDYFAQHPDEKERPTAVPIVSKPKKPIIMPLAWAKAKMKDNDSNTLLKWLRDLPWNCLQRQRLETAILSYAVGTDKFGRTIWWQIDKDRQIRSGKQMFYKEDGHRDKSKNPSWIHAALKDIYPEEEYGYVGCLFGEHLVPMFKDAEVCLVESEKTALICSAFWPFTQKVFVACGGLRNIKPAVLLPLRGRKVIAYPDHDGYYTWKEKLADTDIVLSDWVEKNRDPRLDSPTSDIADVLVRILQSTPNPEALTEEQFFEILKMQHPHFKELSECLNLTPIHKDRTIQL